MIFIDTHTHLYLEEFNPDREEMLERAMQAGVKHCLLPNIDLKSLDPMMDMTIQWPDLCYAMAGLHPTSIEDDWVEQLETISALIANDSVVGIGECGMDMYWDKSRVEEQKRAFAAQLRWSLETGLPVSVHIRDAFTEVFEVLETFGNEHFKGVFHCFSGNLEAASKAIKWGFLLGIGGVVTFRKSHLKELLESVSPEHVVLETDAPFLAPDPFRGKRNEPSYLPYIAETLSGIWKVPVSAVADITSGNALSLYKNILK
jgi:TatD DNase family protein